METKEIKITVAEKTTSDGRKFNVYKTYSKNGRSTDMKFRKDVTDLPKVSGYYTFNVDDMNLNTKGEYPILWIKANPVSFRSLTETTEEAAAKARKEIEDYFG